jgi:hypothetical protein
MHKIQFKYPMMTVIIIIIIIIIIIKLKVNFIVEHTTMAHRGSRCIAILFL